MATNISFAGNSLQSSSIITADIDHHDIPVKDAKTYALAHAMGSKIPFVNYPSKAIKIQGTLSATSIPAMDSLVDTFKSYFINQDQNLDIDYAGATRRYVATMNGLSISRPGGLMFAKFQVEFICTDPFGRDITSTSLLNVTGRTANSFSDSVSFGGTAPFQNTIFTVTLTAVSASGTQSMTIGNGSNGQAITISRSGWAANDQVVVDTYNKTVTVNGVATTFTGAFPLFPPGAAVLSYSDTFTSRTFNETAVCTLGYL